MTLGTFLRPYAEASGPASRPCKSAEPRMHAGSAGLNAYGETPRKGSYSPFTSWEFWGAS